MKICSVCKVEKDLVEFHKKSGSKDGYRSNCKICSSEYNQKIKDRKKEYNKNYIKENKEELKRKKKIYYKENIEYFKIKNKEIKNKLDKDKKKEYDKRYYEKLETKEKRKIYRKKRIETDYLYKSIVIIRHRISGSIYNGGYSKNSKTNEILGCSYLEFKIYIENLFIEDMTWENHGKWHLDHIIPVSLAKTYDEIIKYNHFSNFQPLWAKDNLSKSNKKEPI